MLHADRDILEHPRTESPEHPRPCPGDHARRAGQIAAILAERDGTRDFARRSSWPSRTDASGTSASTRRSTGLVMAWNSSRAIHPCSSPSALPSRRRPRLAPSPTRIRVSSRCAARVGCRIRAENARFGTATRSARSPRPLGRIRTCSRRGSAWAACAGVLGLDDSARQTLEEALRRGGAPPLPYLGQLFLGQVLERAGRADDAARAFQQALLFEPQSQAAAVALSHVLLSSGDVLGARRVLEEALGHAGRRPGARPVLGLIRPATPPPPTLALQALRARGKRMMFFGAPVLGLAVSAAAPGLRATGRRRSPPPSNTLTLDVFVSQGEEGASPGLRAAEFELQGRWGVPGRREPLSAESRPVQAALVFDASSSVAGDKMASLRSAGGAAFLDGLGPKDEASLFAFSHEIDWRARPTTDKDVVRESLAGVRAAGATSAYDALYAALVLADPQKASLIALFTPTGRTTSASSAAPRSGGSRRSRRRSSTWLSAAEPSASTGRGTDRILREIAEHSGGKFWSAGTSRGPPRGFRRHCRFHRRALRAALPAPGREARRVASARGQAPRREGNGAGEARLLGRRGRRPQVTVEATRSGTSWAAVGLALSRPLHRAKDRTQITYSQNSREGTSRATFFRHASRCRR